MIKTRMNHWSCSKLSDFIRGDKKPFVLPIHEWDSWKKDQQSKRPFRYWISETLLNTLQDIVYFPYDLYHTVRVYVRNRWIDKIQYLQTRLQPGQYYDLDTRILYGLFNSLVDFIEIELSHLSKWDKKKKYKFVKGRCIEAAYDYLKMVTNIKYKGKLTDEAKTYRKIQKLYEWWKHTRPNRPDPLVLYTKDKDGEKYYAKIDKLENKYYEEDTTKLVELIKIRSSLWT